MDERRVRYPTGRNGEGTTHRVGLTRHCLASGAVHLPLALRDALPGGEVLALDVERDEAVVLHSAPPRRLAGLTPFFEAHGLQVNDQLEIRVHDGDVRLAAVRRARRERPAEGEERTSAAATSTWTSLDPSTWSPSERGETRGPRTEPRAAETGNDVVERIGSVTVRRLGAGRFASPPAPSVALPAEPAREHADPARQPAAEASAELSAETRPEVSPEPDPVPTDEAFEALLVADPTPEAARDTAVEADRDAGPDVDAATARDDVAAPSPTPATPPAATPDATPAAPPDAGPSGPAPDPPSGPASAAPAGVRQVGLFGQMRADVDPAERVDLAERVDATAPATGPIAADRTAADRTAADRTAADRTAADPATGPTDDAPGRLRGGPPAAPRTPQVPEVREQDLAEIDAHGRVRHGGRPRARRQRRREETVSRAGDLRSRIVRWLHDPETPVIVPYERVQDEFGLDAQVTRDVLAGILDAPPPSLRLTLLREGMLRIARVTVEQEA